MRNSRGQINLKFEIIESLRHRSYCAVEKKLIVHDESRVTDVLNLTLQALLYDDPFCYCCQILQSAVDIFVSQGCPQAARSLVNEFFDHGSEFGSDRTLEASILGRLSDATQMCELLEAAIRVFIVGHEIHHFSDEFAPSVRKRESVDEETDADANGMVVASLFHDEWENVITSYDSYKSGGIRQQHYFNGIDIFYSLFDQMITALLFGDAIFSRVTSRLNQEPIGGRKRVFILAEKRRRKLVVEINRIRTEKVRQYRHFVALSPESSAKIESAHTVMDTFLQKFIASKVKTMEQVEPTRRYQLADLAEDIRCDVLERVTKFGIEPVGSGYFLPISRAEHPIDKYRREAIERMSKKYETHWPGPRSRPAYS